MNNIQRYFNISDREAFIDEKDIKLVYMYLEDKINFNRYSRIMSLGSGFCDVEKIIALNYPNIKITCIDFVEKEIKIENYNNIEYLNIDLRKFKATQFIDKYDLTYSFSVLQYLNNDEIINLNNELLSVLNKYGTIYHFDIPDKRKKYLSRINKIINEKRNILNIFKNDLDFKDSYSNWVSLKPFKNIENSDTIIRYPSFSYDRFEVKINRTE